MLWHPHRTSQEIAADADIRPSLALVSCFACLLGLAYLVTYLLKSYPPSPADWKVWIATWGEQTLAPFIPIPLESYHLFLAGAIIPGLFLLWVSMAGAGKLFSLIFHGKASYKQYLSLFGFSFFPFWIIAAVLDFLYMGFFSSHIVPALNLAYGPLVKTIVYLVPLVMYPLLFGLGGIYNALATNAVERFSAWKSAITGLVTASLAILFLSILVR
jgi:hypothetical protein